MATAKLYEDNAGNLYIVNHRFTAWDVTGLIGQEDGLRNLRDAAMENTDTWTVPALHMPEDHCSGMTVVTAVTIECDAMGSAAKKYLRLDD